MYGVKISVKSLGNAFIKFVFFVAIVGIISNIVGVLTNRDRIEPRRFPFGPFNWERGGRIYDRMRVSRWKTKVPDMSKILPYLYKKKISGRPNPEHIMMLIKETCIAEAVHSGMIIVSPLIYVYIGGWWGVAFAAVYAVGNLPYVIIQRYNRPLLIGLYDRLVARQQKKSMEGEHIEHTDTLMQYR